jgi:hypothetical protein
MNQDPENSAAPISSNVSPVSVTVKVDDKGKVTIECWPNPVVVTLPDSLIVFSLHTEGYRFRQEAPVFLAEPNPDFPYSSWTAKPHVAVLFDLCNKADVFSYTVNVVRTATGEQFSVDPIIRNGEGQGKGN